MGGLISRTVVSNVIGNGIGRYSVTVFRLPRNAVNLLGGLSVGVNLLAGVTRSRLSRFKKSLRGCRRHGLVLRTVDSSFMSGGSYHSVVRAIHSSTVFCTLSRSSISFGNAMKSGSLAVSCKSGRFAAPFGVVDCFFRGSITTSTITLACNIDRGSVVSTLAIFGKLPTRVRSINSCGNEGMVLSSTFLCSNVGVALSCFGSRDIMLFLSRFSALSMESGTRINRLMDRCSLGIIVTDKFGRIARYIRVRTTRRVLSTVAGPSVRGMTIRAVRGTTRLAFGCSRPNSVVLRVKPLVTCSELAAIRGVAGKLRVKDGGCR